MPTQRRAALLALTTLLVATSARAQTAPPPATSPPPATPPAATTPPAPADAPQAAPGAAAAAPVQPLPYTMAPEPAAAPPLQLTERSPQGQLLPEPEPFYRKTWFWFTVGAVIGTVAVIILWNLHSNSNGPPNTTYGNMNAF
ncbi:MAG TPA: hypothetical protein VKQ32_28025 [Polyangia bacterium]|nr:hypothetical protein [Polyangia bacterium]